MNYVIIYWSRYNHNKKIAEYLGKKIEEKGHSAEILNTDGANPKSLPDGDVYIFSASVEAFRIQKHMRNFMKKLSDMNGSKCGIINTHGMKKRNWLNGMRKILEKKNLRIIAETDFVIGEGQNKGEGLEKDWKEKLDSFVEAI